MLYNTIEQVINEWDPIDLFPYCPSDEYELEINRVYKLTKDIREIERFGRVIIDVFIETFGSDVFTQSIEQCIKVACKILSITKINVRKETELCQKCHTKNFFDYLSDYSYGQRLISVNNGSYYAYVNLLEDPIYVQLEKQIQSILDVKRIVSKSEMAHALNDLFGMTCDKIMNCGINLSWKETCNNCGSLQFEPIMVEPVKGEEIDAFPITHEQWNKIDVRQQMEMIQKELILKIPVKEVHQRTGENVLSSLTDTLRTIF